MVKFNTDGMSPLFDLPEAAPPPVKTRRARRSAYALDDVDWDALEDTPLELEQGELPGWLVADLPPPLETAPPDNLPPVRWVLAQDGQCGRCGAPEVNIRPRRWPGCDVQHICWICGNSGQTRVLLALPEYDL